MYGQDIAATSAGAGLAVTGLTIGSWLLIAVAAIALGSAIIAMAVRFRHRKGPRP